jgi:hypothetical protein
MTMELFSFDNELVAGVAADYQQDDLLSLDIIQHAQIPCSQLEFSQRIWPKAFDRPCRSGWLVLKPGHDGRL